MKDLTALPTEFHVGEEECLGLHDNAGTYNQPRPKDTNTGQCTEAKDSRRVADDHDLGSDSSEFWVMCRRKK
jgi:hypothetical protein